MQPNNIPLLFIHIPKTAGSSFRKAAELYFGSSKTWYDYGTESSITHPKIKLFEYQQNDRYKLHNIFNRYKIFLSGHFPYSRYAAFFKAFNTITFVREPSQQIRSHFEHHVRHLNYQNDFTYFIKEKRFQNLQSRNLTGLPLEAYGFIGITERFCESITLINHLYKTDIQTLHDNKNEDKTHDLYHFNNEELTLIHQYNANDYTLYQKAVQLFDQALKQKESNLPLLKGGFDPVPAKLAHKEIRGWITNLSNQHIQTAMLYLNDKPLIKIPANQYRSWAKERNVNRLGFIGFNHTLKTPLKSGDKISLYSIKNQLLSEYAIQH